MLGGPQSQSGHFVEQSLVPSRNQTPDISPYRLRYLNSWMYIKCSSELHTFMFVSPLDLFENFAVLNMLVLGKFAYIFCSLLPYVIIHVE